MALRLRPWGTILLLVAAYLVYHNYYNPEVWRPLKLNPMPSIPDERFDPNRPYPIGVPSKFDTEGNVQSYPGCTIHSPLSNTSEVYKSLLSLHGKLSTSHLSNLYALLPPTSWHMTVFEGLTDKERDYWPQYLDSKASIDEIVKIFKSKLEGFDLQCELPFRLSVAGFDPFQKAGVWLGIGLTIVGQNDNELARIKVLRDRLSQTLGYQMPWHEGYNLHISMGYLLRKLSQVQEEELRSLVMDHHKTMPKDFEFEQVEFARFENMYAFDPVLHLANK